MFARRFRFSMLHRWLFAVALICAASGCGDRGGTAQPPVAPNNVLIVVMDATVATHMYPWGYSRDPAPNFRRVVRDGILFLNVHSQGANTTPSIWSFMTGRYPYVPQPIDTYTTHRPYPEDTMMAEVFRAAGFQTGGFSENPWINSKYGWNKGFDTFKDVPALYDHQGERWSRVPDATERTLASAREWIASQGDARWFCYVHLIRPHDPYDAPTRYTARYTAEPVRGPDHPRAEFRIREMASADPALVTPDDVEYLEDMYDANLRYVDELVGKFVESLKRSGVIDDTLIVLMSDHGEAFMEHDKLGHNTTAYEEMTHVPLAIIAPRSAGFTKGAYNRSVQLVDLMPTFAEVFGLPVDPNRVGTSLVPVLRGQRDAVATRSVSHSAFDHYRVALREGDLKLIAQVDPAYRDIASIELYDLKADPAEANDLSGDAALAGPLVISMREYLAEAERKDTSTDPVLSPYDRELMEAIGYGKSQ